MQIKVDVWEPYPCWITLTVGENSIRFAHYDFLEFKHAIFLAEKKILAKLPKDDWHTVDPKYAKG